MSRLNMYAKFSLSFLILILVSQVATADLVYNLVDHGVPQHTLIGTISVTSTAPNDGILTTAEITEWQVEVSGSTVNFAISSVGGIVFFQGNPLAITSTEIIIPASAGSLYDIIYSEFDPGAGMFNEYIDQNTGFQGFVAYDAAAGGGVFINPAHAPRVHAARVPEPSAFLFLGLAGMGLVGRRKSKRAKTN